MNESATLEAEAARIDLLGRPLLASLSVRSEAPRLALTGDWSALFRLLSGEATLESGALRVAGVAAPLVVQQGVAGLLRLDPLLPVAWSAERLLCASAELAGQTPAQARRSMSAVLERLGLGALSARRLGHLQVAERRALLVAHALVTEPLVLCLELPLQGLDSSAQQLLLEVIERAAVGRRLLISLSDPERSAAERELLARADESLRLEAGLALPEPRSSTAPRRVTATICRNHTAFAAALAARGLRAQATHEAGLLNALTSPGVGPAWRYLVELSAGGTAPILDAALETEAGLVELTPLR